MIAGLGQGWMEQEFITANVPLSRRGAGMEEFVAALRAAWGRTRVDHVLFSNTAPTSLDEQIQVLERLQAAVR